jgi:hypothetical protein
MTDADDRVSCEACCLYNPPFCSAARHGDRLDVQRNYGPAVVDTPPRRCPHYRPHRANPDQRTGRERWPRMYAEYEAALPENQPRQRIQKLKQQLRREPP